MHQQKKWTNYFKKRLCQKRSASRNKNGSIKNDLSFLMSFILFGRSCFWNTVYKKGCARSINFCHSFFFWKIQYYFRVLVTLRGNTLLLGLVLWELTKNTILFYNIFTNSLKRFFLRDTLNVKVVTILKRCLHGKSKKKSRNP